MSVNKLLNAIKKQREDGKKEVKFEGNFREYLELVSKDPSLVKSSHRRLYDAIVDKGVEKMPDSNPRKSRVFDNDSVKVYNYFEDHFFGVEKVIELDSMSLTSSNLVALPVPPPTVRPAIMQGKSIRGEDDLTYRLLQIMRANSKLEASIEKQRPECKFNFEWC